MFALEVSGRLQTHNRMLCLVSQEELLDEFGAKCAPVLKAWISHFAFIANRMICECIDAIRFHVRKRPVNLGQLAEKAVRRESYIEFAGVKKSTTCSMVGIEVRWGCRLQFRTCARYAGRHHCIGDLGRCGRCRVGNTSHISTSKRSLASIFRESTISC